MNRDYLKAETAKRLPAYVSNDLTTSVGGVLIFLTHVFPNSYTYGWWSHSPWGRVQDGEQGYCLIDDKGQVIEECPTRVDHMPAGEDFRRWRADIKEQYGVGARLCDAVTGKMIWKITET